MECYQALSILIQITYPRTNTEYYTSKVKIKNPEKIKKSK